MFEKNGFKYSSEWFKEYKFRGQFKVYFDKEAVIVDIYTTDPDKKSFFEVISNRLKIKACSIQMTHYCSKDYDDRCSKMIREILMKNKCDYGINNPIIFQSDDHNKRFFKPK